MTSLYSARTIVRNPQQYRKNIDSCNGKRNVFRSVYHFDFLKNGKPDYSDIIISFIFVEFDGKNSYEVSQKLALDLSYDNIKFRINFSGRRGFHFYISTEHKDMDRKTYLRLLYEYIINKYGIANDMDSCTIGNIRQLRRVENTIHPRTGLYCIPITYQEMLFLSFDEIKELAEKPRNFDVCWIEGNELKLDNINVNDNINEKEVIIGNGEFKEFDDVLPEPCEARILYLRHPTHEERFYLCLWLSWCFRGGTDINTFNLTELKEKIIAFMRTRNWDDYSESLGTAKSTRYQVENIINKRYNWLPNCEWRRMYHMCVSEYCYEEKKRKKENYK